MYRSMLALLAATLLAAPAHASLTTGNPLALNDLKVQLNPPQPRKGDCQKTRDEVNRLIEALREKITAKVSDNAYLNARIVRASSAEDFPAILADAGYTGEAEDVSAQIRQYKAYVQASCRRAGY